MMAKKGGLGTGVDTLLRGSTRQRNKQRQQASLSNDSTVAAERSNEAITDRSRASVVELSADKAGEAAGGDRLINLALDQITPGGYQPRRQFDETALKELADSLKQQGLVQPILVRSYAGRYELIAGERRWRAAQIAGLATIPAIVRQLDDRSVAAVSLIENIQRKDLNALEEAHALQRLRDEFGMTQEAVAKSVGRSRSAVTNLLRLLELHDEVKKLLEQGQIDMGHARALHSIAAQQQPRIAQQVIDKGLSVRATEALVREQLQGNKSKTDKQRKAGSQSDDPNVQSLERKLGDVLGARVRVIQSAGGAGKLEISYNSLDELDGIIGHIK